MKYQVCTRMFHPAFAAIAGRWLATAVANVSDTQRAALFCKTNRGQSQALPPIF